VKRSNRLLDPESRLIQELFLIRAISPGHAIFSGLLGDRELDKLPRNHQHHHDCDYAIIHLGSFLYSLPIDSGLPSKLPSVTVYGISLVSEQSPDHFYAGSEKFLLGR
jgi:hypothetical protein